jgi:hypothetical protein
MSIKSKLYAGFGVLVLIAVALAVYAITEFNGIKTNVVKMNAWRIRTACCRSNMILKRYGAVFCATPLITMRLRRKKMEKLPPGSSLPCVRPQAQLCRKNAGKCITGCNRVLPTRKAWRNRSLRSSSKWRPSKRDSTTSATS